MPADVTVRPAAASDYETIRGLLATNGWGHRVGEAAAFVRLLDASQLKLVAVLDTRIVGFVRGISDGLSNGYLSMVVVDTPHRRQGVGRLLIETALGMDTHVTWVLRAERDGASEFFAKLGFSPADRAMERPRRKA